MAVFNDFSGWSECIISKFVCVPITIDIMSQNISVKERDVHVSLLVTQTEKMRQRLEKLTSMPGTVPEKKQFITDVLLPEVSK